MSKIKNGLFDQYGAEPFEQQQFGTAGVEGVKSLSDRLIANKIVKKRVSRCIYSHGCGLKME